MYAITFIISTYNEEKRISYAIQNLIKYGEVIILDGGSTDNTQKISEKLGARFTLRPGRTNPYVETKENFDYIKSIIKTDWVYWGYVDNILPRQLLEKLTEISKQDEINFRSSILSFLNLCLSVSICG